MKRLMLVLFVLLPTFAVAQTAEECFEKGKKSYESKDYAEAYKWFKQAADQGHANGQNNLGYMYVKGYGVKQNYSEAAEWYRKAAEQGYAVAQNNLGDLYRDGSGVEKDYNEALKWYRKAAEQSYAKGQANLGYDLLKFYDYQLNHVLEPGDFEIMIGPDSNLKNLRKTILTIP